MFYSEMTAWNIYKITYETITTYVNVKFYEQYIFNIFPFLKSLKLL